MPTLDIARHLITALPLASLLVARASASVIVVDAAGGGTYTQIQPAVDAAVDGDTILVKTGSYPSFVVNNKSLAIVGDAGSDVQVVGAVRARNMIAAKTLLIENLHATGYDPTTISLRHGLYLFNNAGRVRVQSCTFVGLSGMTSPAMTDGFAGVRVESCAAVSLSQITSTGGAAGAEEVYESSSSGEGLSAVGSNIAIYDCTLRGGTGANAPMIPFIVNGGDGGHGCSVGDTTLFASGSTFIAGNGGNGMPIPCFNGESYGGDGGDGIRLASNSTARLLDCTQQAGAGGQMSSSTGCSFPGAAGDARTGTTFVDLAGPSKHMTVPSPVRENTVEQLEFTGTPGDRIALVITDESDHVWKPAWKGMLLVKLAHPQISVPVGTIPAGGTLQVPWGILDLGGLSSRVMHLQPVFVSDLGQRTLGNSSSMVILDAAY